MPTLRFFVPLAIAMAAASCQSSSQLAGRRGPDIHGVKTTAYTHTERDHRKYKVANAAGGKLKYGDTRSAAADWSVYPVGTVFKIEGDSHLYEVDDYGSALVGTETIDLYKPSKAAMREWGARNVNIKVLKWGSFAQSLAIIEPREKKASHIREMISEIKKVAPKQS